MRKEVRKQLMGPKLSLGPGLSGPSWKSLAVWSPPRSRAGEGTLGCCTSLV
jgi:hypothetical protein